MLFEPDDWTAREWDIYMRPGDVPDFVSRICDGLQGQLTQNIEGAFYDTYMKQFTNITYLQVGTTRLKVHHSEYPAMSISFSASTLMMNYLTWDHICVGYPYFTLRRLGLIHSTYPPDYLHIMSQPQDVIKYIHRGFTMYSLPLRQPIKLGRTDTYHLQHTDLNATQQSNSGYLQGDICPKSERIAEH